MLEMRIPLTFTFVALFFSTAASPVDQVSAEVLILPADAKKLRALDSVGTTTMEQLGVSRMIRPGSDQLYLILDRQISLEHQIGAQFGHAEAFESDISISSNSFGSTGEFVHISITGPDSFNLRYIKPTPPLYKQLISAKENLELDPDISLLEYAFEAASCKGLSDSIGQVMTSFKTIAGTIGKRPTPPEEVWLDGASYDLELRMHRSIAKLFVGLNDEPIFDPVDSVFELARNCSEDLRPKPLTLVGQPK